MPSIVESGQVPETFRPTRPGLRVVLGALAVVAACVGAAWRVRALDRLEAVTTLEAPAAAGWSRGADGQYELAVDLDRAVPAGGALRLRACAPGDAPELWMRLRPPGGGAAVRVRLSSERTTSARCAEARWTAAPAGRASVWLVAKSSAPTLRSVTCRTGGVIRGVDLLPLLLLALGVGAMVVAPRRREAPGEPAYAPTLPWPTRGVEGLVLTVVGFFGVHVVAQAPVALWGFRGATMLGSVVLQQLTLALLAAAMMGAFTAARPRVALELGAPEADWFRRALVAAAALVGFAMATALLIKDAGDAPIARVIDAMPTRYVIAFGALCAPLPEELFFRGLLGRMAEARAGARSPLLPVALPAAFFTAMHAMQLQGAWLGLLPIAAVGLVNGWLRWRTRGLVAPWAVHTLYNATLALTALA